MLAHLPFSGKKQQQHILGFMEVPSKGHEKRFAPKAGRARRRVSRSRLQQRRGGL